MVVVMELFSGIVKGETYGYWTVVDKDLDAVAKGRSKVLCVCRCGREKSVDCYTLRHGKSVSCGCASAIKNDADSERDDYISKGIFINDVNNRLTAIGKAIINNTLRVCCLCTCGQVTHITPYSFKSGKVKSCGCYATEMKTKHGASYEPLYPIWISMISRCLNTESTSYKHYGGRGITVCERWQNSFEDFKSDMGERPSKNHSIDRIDNDGHYEPGNVRWSTQEEQTRNKRNNRKIEYYGELYVISDLAKIVKMSRATLRKHLNNGMDIYEIVKLVNKVKRI